MRFRIWWALAVLMLAGCGDDGAEATSTESEGQAVAAATEASPDAEVNPCEILTEATVRAVITLAAETSIEQRRGGGVTSKLCTYRWDDPDFDQEAHNREMMERMQEAMREGRMPQGLADMAASARNGGEVSYTHLPDAPDAAAARRSFDSAIEFMHRGISREIERGSQKGQTVTFQYSTESVEGVGDAAEWSERLHQLSVVDGRQFFHVSVRVAEDAAGDLELAKQLASRLGR